MLGIIANRLACLRSARVAPGQSHLLRGLMAGITFLAAAAVSAQPAPDLDAAQALLAEGRAAEVYDLLAPFEAQFAGDPRYDYPLARSALDSGKPSIASFIYERIDGHDHVQALMLVGESSFGEVPPEVV